MLADQIRETQQQLKELRRTPCARCGHSWNFHSVLFGGCLRTEYVKDGDKPNEYGRSRVDCRCKAFVENDDPSLFDAGDVRGETA